MPYKKNSSAKVSLKWSMMRTLILGWVVPLTLLTIIVLNFVYRNLNQQTERTIINSAEKAVETTMSRLQDSITASKNASYLPTIREQYTEYALHQNKLHLYKKLTLFLDQQYKFDDRFLVTLLILPDLPQEDYFTYRNKYQSTHSNVQYFKDNVFEQVMGLYKDLDTDVAFIPSKDRVYMVRNIMSPSYYPYAIIVMELNNEVIFNSMENIWGYEKGAIFKNQNFLWGDTSIEYLTKYNGITDGSSYYKDENGSYTFKTLKFNQDYFTFVAKIHSDAILYEMDALRYVVIFTIPLLIGFALLVFRFFHRKITKPILHLINAAHQIQGGHYGTQIKRITTSQEFAYLGDAFNSMSLELKSQFEKIYLEELALKDATIMALQSQINPHFLNNTLEIINWEARLMENYKVSGMIEALSTILNATMNRNQQQLITLAEELSYADAYFFIISTRLGDRFHVIKDIDESLLQEPVPMLIIQPIIENAVSHGMNEQNQGTVTLRIYKNEDKLFIEVKNQGRLSEEDKKKIDFLLGEEKGVKKEKATNLGIRNVNRRLKIIYGNDCGLTIKSDKDNSTSSIITVKLNKTNQDK